MMCLPLHAILIEHLDKNIIVGGGHIHKLEPHVINGGVKRVARAPFHTSCKGQIIFIRYFTRLINSKLEVCASRNGLAAFDLKSTGADIGELAHKIASHFIQHTHVIGKIPAR